MGATMSASVMTRRILPDSLHRAQQFGQLCAQATSCGRCERMRECVAVLGPQNGNLDAEVMFVAEAPGRLGANRTRVPLLGDRTGDNFCVFLSQTGWNREDVFVTNAVLCNPRNEVGNNSVPALRETRNCACFLKEQIDLVDPLVVVSLGVTALKALAMVSSHSLTLRSSVGQPVPWYGRTLVSLYHPGPRALVHRPSEVQIADYIALAEFVLSISRLPEDSGSSNSE